MRGRLVWIAAAFAALALAGGASAYVLTRHVTLKAGACTTFKGVRFCAAKAVTKTVTRTQQLTITQPAQTVTQTVTVAPPPPPTQNFAGSGGLTLAPFTVPTAGTLSWTLAPDVFGSYENFILDCTPSSLFVNALNAASGQTYVSPGTYACSVNAEDAWTIHIG